MNVACDRSRRHEDALEGAAPPAPGPGGSAKRETNMVVGQVRFHPSPPTPAPTERRPPRAVAGAFLFLSGCGVIPSVNILGSFFPAWLISIVIGVILTIISHQAFVLTKIAPYLRPAAILYPCLILLWTLTTWLVVFAS